MPVTKTSELEGPAETPTRASWRARFVHLVDAAALHPDMARGARATVAFMVPLLLALVSRPLIEVSFVAIVAQNVAMVDLRGDYRLRFALLLTMVAVFVGAATLGATVSNNGAVAILATGLMAVTGGLWRHLSGDYGPPLAIAATLIFFLALSAPEADQAIGAYGIAALVGGLWGVMIQVALWPFRPQHALRRTTADGWLAVATLCDALATAATNSATGRAVVSEAENALRLTLDQTYASLATAPVSPIRDRLDALNLAAARLGTRIVALNTALESAIQNQERPAAFETVFGPVLQSLANLSRNTALAVVSRQPAHLAAFEVRIRTVSTLLSVIRGRLQGEPATGQLAEIVAQVARVLPDIHAALRATVERATEQAAVSFELRDLHLHALRPLASALNLSTEIEPALVRYTLRLAALTMAGAAVFTLHPLPHGYWLPFTAVVVLQPDYGSTRQRAGQRMLGTIAGSVLASVLLWVGMPQLALVMATAAFVFGFAYYLKRNYTWAIFCITVVIVLITEAHETVTIAFTLERLASTAAGGALALAAAFVFWPVWERDRLPAILARMFRANRDYLALLLNRVQSGGAYDTVAVAAKRAAESANTAAFSSLRRLSGDPKNRREGLEAAAALVHGNQRLTRTLNLIALNLTPGTSLASLAVERFAGQADKVFTHLVAGVEGTATEQVDAAALQAAITAPLGHDSATERQRWIAGQLARAATELAALLLALQQAERPAS